MQSRFSNLVLTILLAFVIAFGSTACSKNDDEGVYFGVDTIGRVPTESDFSLDVVQASIIPDQVTVGMVVQALHDIVTGQQAQYVIYELDNGYFFAFPLRNNWGVMMLNTQSNSLATPRQMYDFLTSGSKASPFTLQSMLEFMRARGGKDITVDKLPNPMITALTNLLVWAANMGVYSISVLVVPVLPGMFDPNFMTGNTLVEG